MLNETIVGTALGISDEGVLELSLMTGQSGVFILQISNFQIDRYTCNLQFVIVVSKGGIYCELHLLESFENLKFNMICLDLYKKTGTEETIK